MRDDDIRNDYYEWVCSLVGGKRSRVITYHKLLEHLYNTEFVWSIPKDANRAEDGKDLRWRYTLDRLHSREIPECLDGPCSVLEMLIALALRCEETIMDDPRYGNRSGQWFWEMIGNLGLTSLTDDKYDKRLAQGIINRFLNRDYEPNGEGGLFVIRHCDDDLRRVEIWVQMLWHLNDIT